MDMGPSLPAVGVAVALRRRASGVHRARLVAAVLVLVLLAGVPAVLAAAAALALPTPAWAARAAVR